jgi:uncharacterized protein
MKSGYHLSEHHVFNRLGKHIVFNVETMLFYEVTPLVHDLMAYLSGPNNSDPVKALRSKYAKREIINALDYLKKERCIKEYPSNGKKPVLRKRRGIRHLELMVTHACNMRCRYCYGAEESAEWKSAPHLYGATTSGMSLDTAIRGVDFLFEASGRQKELSIVFFGGEPLLEYSLMEKIVPYIREREKEKGKKVDLSLSTNGLLLSDAVVRFLVNNRIGCQISIDGPKDIQDSNRCLPNGKGSYEYILPGVKRLIDARHNKVPARVTVAHSNVKLAETLKHLLSLGFGSVHMSPVIGRKGDTPVTHEDVEEIKKQQEAIAVFLVKSLRNNRRFNYSNLVRFIRQTRVIKERIAHYCGAGRTYFALSQDGGFYPCHRFVGMEEFRMGDIHAGIDLSLQKKILDFTVDNRPGCKDCWARYLCGGGCWKHAVDMNGCLEVPDNDLSCEITRHEIECAMAINSELKVSDQDILSDIYEEATEPYLISEKGGEHA